MLEYIFYSKCIINFSSILRGEINHTSLNKMNIISTNVMFPHVR